MLLPVIMAGGMGTRLWPLSREEFPKQFVKVNSDQSMLQDTISRLEFLGCSSPVIIANESHRFILAEQIRELSRTDCKLILKPVSRGTAASIAIAAFYALECDENSTLLVLPADHLIECNQDFISAINTAALKSKEGKLVSLGVCPEHATSAYGYIKASHPSQRCSPIEQFIEKPPEAEAAELIKDKSVYWNSGMFVDSAKLVLEEIKRHIPKVYSACFNAYQGKVEDYDFIRVDKNSFIGCPEISIDHAVMEKTTNAEVVKLDIKWTDLGSWASVWEVSNKSPQQNATYGDVLNIASTNSFIYSDSKLVVTYGVDDLVIVDTKDVLFVSRKNESQAVKDIVAELKRLNRKEVASHQEVSQPWSKFLSMKKDPAYNKIRSSILKRSSAKRHCKL